MSAAGIHRAFVLGIAEGGPLALLFARTYPSLVEGLILHSTFAVSAMHRLGDDQRVAERHRRDAWISHWGCDDTITLDFMGPSASDDYRRWHPRYERHSVGPAGLRELTEMIDLIDVDELLAEVSVPTLIVHRRGD
jgi:pimeloyl-ACP methyl ester carboxylesterase